MTMFNCSVLLLFVIVVLTDAAVNKTTKGRDVKSMGIFSVVRFPNTACTGTSGLNGTCYTSEECESKGGETSGACASSFGVCCIFSLACGSTTSENNTYHTITAYNTLSDPQVCDYTVCPNSADICKLRIDLTTFNIAAPVTYNGPITAGIIVPAINGIGPSVGHCTTDSFSVSVSGGVSPPVICGLNSGHHLYVAATGCNKLSFNIGTGTSATRSWSLKVSQLDCANRLTDHDCLQYLTGISGTFSSFNFDTSLTTITSGSNVNHLANQHYSICFRREEAYCVLCFSPYVQGIGTIKGSFGVSASGNAAAAKGANELKCTGASTPGVFADYIEVNGLQSGPVAQTAGNSVVNAPVAATASKTCGPYFSFDDSTAIADATACTTKIPFRWGVHFDDSEVTVTGADSALNTYEQCQAAICDNVPSGSLGFHMHYWQVAC